MKAVTIDQFGIEQSRRYAEDQQALDSTYTKDAAPYSEAIGTSSIYSSAWDKLFEFSARNHPFAVFTPPPGLPFLQRRRFFSLSLVPSLDGFRLSENESTEQVEAFSAEKQRLMTIESKDQKSLAHFERERSILFNLFAAMEQLNEYLGEIHSRKLQYQKG